MRLLHPPTTGTAEDSREAAALLGEHLSGPGSFFTMIGCAAEQQLLPYFH